MGTTQPYPATEVTPFLIPFLLVSKVVNDFLEMESQRGLSSPETSIPL